MLKTVLAGGLVCLLLASSCGKKQEKIKPVLENITESVYASGLVKSNGQYEVFSRAGGIITDIWVNEGDLVKKGQAILQLSDRTAQLNTENARIAAQFSTRQANFARLQELQENIGQASIKLKNDSLLWERQKVLWAQDIGTRNELEQRELAYKSSFNSFQAARLRYIELQRQISLQEQQSGNSLQIARSLNGDYTVKSEVDGRVYSLLKEKGEMVSTQTPVAVIGGADVFLLELQVDEFDIARITPGLKILLTMDSYKGQVFEAVVSTIDPYMNQRTKTFTVKAAFVKPPSVLYPNLTCEANIIVREKQHSLTIPVFCLIDGEYVLLANKEKRKVGIGMKDYRKVEILSGLSVNDIILKPGL